MKTISTTHACKRLLALLAFFLLTAFAAQAADPLYNVNDILAINAIIDAHPELGWSKAAPADGASVPSGGYGRIKWSFTTDNRRVYELDLFRTSLTGTLNVSELTALVTLDCSENQLTTLDVTGCNNLKWLNCSYNKLTSLNLTGLPLTVFNGEGQTETIEMTLNPATQKYEAIISLNEPIFYDFYDLSYSNGKLISDKNSITSRRFAVQTGLVGNLLSGWLELTYNTHPPHPAVGVYNRDDVAVINAIIQNNGLGWTKAPADGSSVPADWTGVFWSDEATNKRIVELYLNGKNLTGTVEVSKLSELRIFRCYDNLLTGLNVTALTKLTFLDFHNNQLSSISVMGLWSLAGLSCSNNQLTALNLGGLTNLEDVSCTNNQLVSLNLSGLSQLKILICQYNRLPKLNAGELSRLETLNCADNLLTELDVLGSNNLKELYCSNNKLADLKTSGLGNLTELDCRNNKLTEFNASGLSNLTKLECGNNLLTALIVVGRGKLELLSCEENLIRGLDLTGLTKLETLDCFRNKLTSLNLTGLPALTTFRGYEQTSSLTLTYNSATLKYEGDVLMNNPQFSSAGISYSNGKLIANNNTVSATNFSASTGVTGKTLQGALSLTYGSTPTFIPVTNITGVPTTATAKTPLTLTATITPSDATNKTIVWSVKSAGATGATINGNTLNTTAGGTVVVTATIVHGASATTDFKADFTITVSSSTVTHNTSDVAVINAIIQNNGLGWTKAPDNGSSIPADWTGVVWSDEATNKRILELYVNGKNLTGTLNVSGLSELRIFRCHENLLTGLNASGLSKLTFLDFHNNQLASIDLAGLSSLWALSCSSNKLTALDVSRLTSLVELYCSWNEIVTLNISGLGDLKIVACHGNLLTSLNASGLGSLESLTCTDNNLAELNVSGLGSLKHLRCYNNQLAELNVSGSANLEELLCFTNQLHSLNVSGLTKLMTLNCDNNLLISLDLTGLSALSTLYCISQNASLTMAWNPATQKYEAAVALNNPHFYSEGFTYSNGKLAANNNVIVSTAFTVETGLAGKNLSGTLWLTYSGSATFVPVTGIAGGPATATAGVPLTLTVDSVVPRNATNKTIAWSVKSPGATGATISGNILNTTAAGTAVITATIANGAGPATNFTADFSITVATDTVSVYHKGDVAVINAIIQNNGLGWTKAPDNGSSVPNDWTGVAWSNEAKNKRVARLDFDLQGLTGTLNLSGLAGLEQLACYNNQLTALNLSGLSKLKRVYAYNNRLTALNISGLADLTFLDCEDNQLTALNLSALPKLDALACSGNKLSSLNLSGLSSLRELSCSDNQLTALNLTGLSALSSLYGINQTASLTMAWNPATQKYEAAIALNNPTNLFNGLSYANGKLIANNNSVASTNFTVETGLPGKTLSGTLQLTYNTGSANEAAAIPPLKAVSHNGTLTVSGLNVGDDLKVYNISGILIYNVRKTEAAEVRVDIELGVYVVVSGDRRIKVLAR